MNLNPTEMILQLVVSLAIVVGMIWLLVKFLSLKSKWLYRNRPLRVLGGVGLGPQKSLQLVEIGGMLYVLGVGQDVTLLRVIDDPEEQERIKKDFAVTRDSASFPWLDRFQARKDESIQTDFTSVLKSKLGEVRRERHETLGEWLDGQERSTERKIKD